MDNDKHFDINTQDAILWNKFHIDLIRECIGKTDNINEPLCRHVDIISRELALKGIQICRVCGKPLPSGEGRFNDHLVLKHEMCIQPICIACSKTNPDAFHCAFENGVNRYKNVIKSIYPRG
jgi:hypothetical protein